MKSIKVTKLENQVLKSMAAGMFAEYGYSDYTLPDLIEDTGLTSKVLRGVASSLIKKGLIQIDEREDEGFKNNISQHIWYLNDDATYLVPHWKDEFERIVKWIEEEKGIKYQKIQLITE